jgi:DNA-binding CsgD family transcriptional regulator
VHLQGELITLKCPAAGLPEIGSSAGSAQDEAKLERKDAQQIETRRGTVTNISAPPGTRGDPAATDAFFWARAPAPKRPIDPSECVSIFQRRLYLLDVGLTVRERKVCALALAGVSIEGSAYELGIKKSSIITYRKRAYARLGISSLNELFVILTFAKFGSDGINPLT